MRMRLLVKIFALTLAALLIVIGLSAWLVTRNYHHASHCQIVHVVRIPANVELHHGCPEGSTILRNFFIEVDGTKIDACMKPTGDDCVDELRPGESMSVRLNRMK